MSRTQDLLKKKRSGAQSPTAASPAATPTGGEAASTGSRTQRLLNQRGITTQQDFSKPANAESVAARQQLRYTGRATLGGKTYTAPVTDEDRKEYENLLKWQRWQNAPQAADFAQKSAYVDTYAQSKEKFSPLSGIYTGTGYDDILYAYINQQKRAQEIQGVNDMGGPFTMYATTHDYWKDLDDDTIKTFNYIYATESPEAAYEYIDAAVNKTYTGIEALGLGALQGSGLASVSAALGSIGNDESKQRNKDWYTQLQRETAEASEEHPGASKAGSIAGGLGTMLGISGGIGAIPAVASLPAWVGGIVSSAGSLAGTTAIQEAGDVATGQIKPGDYALDVAVSGGAGAVGGLASAGVAAGSRTILSNLGLIKNPMANQIVNTVNAGLSGAAFSLGSSGVSEMSKYLRDREGYELDERQVAQDALVAFAFSSISYFARTVGGSGNAAPQADPNARPETTYFEGIDNIDDLKKAYRTLSKQNHPDLGGSTEVMAQINSEYEALQRYLLNQSVARAASAYEQREKQAAAGQDTTAASDTLRKEAGVLMAAVQDGTLAGTEAAQAAEIIQAVATAGATGGMAAQAATTDTSIVPTADTASGDIAAQLVSAGATPEEAEALAPVLNAVLTGEEISGNQAGAVATNEAAVAVLESATGEEINTDAPLSEVKATIRGLASRQAAAEAQAPAVDTTAPNLPAQSQEMPTESLEMLAAAQEMPAVQQEVPASRAKELAETMRAEEAFGAFYGEGPHDVINQDTAEQDVRSGAFPAVEDMTQRNMQAVEEFAKTMDKAGAAAMMQMYDGSQSADQYVAGMMRAYNAGKNGTDRAGIMTDLQGLTPPQAQAAYLAGQADGANSHLAQGAGAGYNEAKVDGLTQLKTTLSKQDTAVVNGIRYAITRTADGYFVRIDRDNAKAGGAITDARSKIFRDGPYETREEAAQTLMDVAAANKLTEVQEGASNGKEEVIGRADPAESERGVQPREAGNDGHRSAGRRGGGLRDGSSVVSGADAGSGERSEVDRYGLTDDERSALLKYKSSDSFKLNAALREDVTLDAQQSEMVKYLDSAVEKLPRYEGIVYRRLIFDGVGDEEEMTAFLSDHKPGEIVRYAAYTSTSVTFDGFPFPDWTEYGVTLEIDGKNAHDLSGYGNNFENEALFPRNSRVIVKEVLKDEDGRPYIKMEEVTENGQLKGQGDHGGGLERNHRGKQGTSAKEYSETVQQVPAEKAVDSNMHGVPEVDSGRRSVGETSLQGVRGENKEGLSEYGAAVHPEERGEAVQPVRETEQGHNHLQSVSERNPERGGKGQSSLQGVRGEEVSTPTPAEQVQEKSALATQEKPRGGNYAIAEKGGVKMPTTPKSRYTANVAAIKTLRKIMGEGRMATPQEQDTLAKYTGWGGVTSAFDEKNAEWAKEVQQLKKMLDDGEYRTAKASILDAYYTTPEIIRSMYHGLAKIGFTGGRILEPSAGVGRFLGAMPQELIPGVRSFTAVELDKITGNIAKYLYPNADVRVQGYETANIPQNYMDLAIGNVPFGNISIADKAYPKAVTSSIHNYFIAKTLDKLRPGGIACLITSSGTMDAEGSAARDYFMQQADLIGAIRLPNTAFEGTGTNVVSDILVFKKREPGTAYHGEAFAEIASKPWEGKNMWGSYRLNEYFVKHPEMVLGTAAYGKGQYGRTVTTYNPLESRYSLGKQIERTFAKIGVKMDYPAQRTQEQIRAEIKADAGKVKEGGIVHKGGKLYKNENGTLVDAGIRKADEARMVGITEIRDVARALLDMQLSGADTKAITKQRTALNKLYDAFVAKHGYLHDAKNNRLVAMDADTAFLRSLESYDEKTGTVTKSALFEKNTVNASRAVTHVESVSDALIVVMNESGSVDTARIAELTGQSEETVRRELLESKTAFKDRNGKLELAETYLSGNVKAKLRDARALAEADPDYQRNVEELEKIIPPDIAPEDISVRPGVTWIPDSHYSQFASEMLGSGTTYDVQRGEQVPDVEVRYNRPTGSFTVQINSPWVKGRAQNISEWGTSDRSFANIFEAMLNSKNLSVWRTQPDGSRILDKQATAQVAEKREKILAEFQRWIWADDTRKTELAKLYNDVFNNSVTPKYDGSKLTVEGINGSFSLRSHQANAVHRIVVSGGNTLLAHKVGAGKTLEMAAAAMKLRQLGVVKKPVFVVPKSLVPQWSAEFFDYFPAAKVLAPSEKDFSAGNRKTLVNRIATGDWDAVILSTEQFKRIPMSAEHQEAFYQEQIDALEMAIAAAGRAKGKDPSVRNMERSKKSLEAKLKKIGDMAKDKDNISFEQLGVDSLFVDEAHQYKNLFYTSQMQNVSGLSNKDGSQQAFDLYMKVRFLQKLNGGRGIVFATATPVMNSMSEMYIMQRYLQGDLLEAKGLDSFDAWANQFGEVRTVLEMNPSGKGYRQKQSFSRFKNLAELQQMFRGFADVVTDIPLKLPKLKDGKRTIVECEPSQFQMDYIDELAKRADAIKGRKVDPKTDNMLKITSDGRKLSYSQRMIDPSLPYEEGGKIVKCADNVAEIYRQYDEHKAAQLVFCDISTPKGGNVETDETGAAVGAEDAQSISIYDDLKNMLIQRGIPAEEIAFIHDADTAEKKTKLFADVNAGTVRVLIGSTSKMGVGMNAQQRLVALHHLDAPWRPGDIEQREGRMLRQKNMFADLDIPVQSFVYITKKTFDSRMWDNLERKAAFIHQVMSGDLTAREAEGDGDFALSAAEIKAIASGNPLIMEQFEVAADLQRLETLERAHAKEVSEAKGRIAETKRNIAIDEANLPNYRKDAAAAQDTRGDKFKAQIGGKLLTERKAAGEAIIAASKKAFQPGEIKETMTGIGKFAGFELSVTSNSDMLLRGAAQYRATVNMQSPIGTTTTLEKLTQRPAKLVELTEKRIKEGKANLVKLEQAAAASFDKAAELEEKRLRNAEILAELNPAEDQNVAELDGDGEAGESKRLVEPDVVPDGAPHPERWEAARVGSSDVKVKPVSEIIAQMQHDFRFHITNGHVRGSGVRGQFNTRDKGIRSKIANDLPTVCHELGHALDDRYDILGSNLTREMQQELEKALGNLASAYKPEEIASEGLAEFLRQYLQNREVAAIDYPEFTRHFLGMLDGKDRALLGQTADDVNAYYSLDADSAASSVRLREEGRVDLRTSKEKIRQMGDDMYQAWVDSNHGIKLFDEATGSDVYKRATNAAYSDAIAGQVITGDLTDANGQYVGPGLGTVLHGINTRDKKEYKAFGEYLIVKHGPERLVEGMRIFADDRKNSTQWMQKRQAELEAQYPEFEAASDRLYQFIADLNKVWGVDTGVIGADQLDSWQKRWRYYVPLNRTVEKSGRAGAKRGFANQKNPYKRAKGSGLDVIHPVDNVIDNIVTLVNVGVRNNVMRELRNSAIQLGADASWMEKVPAPLVPRQTDLTGVKAMLLDEIDQSSSLSDAGKMEAGDIIANLNDVLLQFERGKAHGDVVTVMVGGKPEFWKINDKLLLESVTSMSPAKLHGILEAYAVTTRFMTANITGNNPVWSIFSNAPRDLGTFAVYSKDRRPFKNLAAIGSTYINSFKETVKLGSVDPLYAEYLAMGGGHSSAYSADADLAKKARKKLTYTRAQRVLDTVNPLNWVSFVSDTIEMGPRFATYKLMREAGLTPQEAFYEAMDVTTNFRRSGGTSRQVNKVVPFFNASVQGIDKFRRFFSGSDATGGERAKVVRNRWIAFFAASAALAALMYGINNGDKEAEKDYQQLSNYTKNSFWCIPLGDGRYFTIPKPRELAVLTSFMESCMEQFIGKNNHAFDEFYQYAVENFLPSVVSDVAQLPSNIKEKGVQQGILDTVAGAIGSAGMLGTGAYMMANRDFLGRPIESTTMQALEPKDRYNASTSRTAYWMGQAFGLSPAMTDYFGNQVLGYLWKVPRALFPVGEDPDYSLGVKSTYVKDNAYSQDLVNWLYDQSDKTAMAKISDPKNMDKAIAAKLDSSMTDFYGTFNGLNKGKMDSNERRNTRQTVLTMISEYRKSVDQGYTSRAQEAVYRVVRATGETKYMPSVMNDYVKDGDGKKHTLTDTQYVSYQTNYLNLYWGYVEENLNRKDTVAKRAAVLDAAKTVAKEQATNTVLRRIGATETSYAAKYDGVSANSVVTFRAQKDLVDDDGFGQDDAIEILKGMIEDGGTSKEEAYMLFRSVWDKSDKNNPWKRYAP